MRSAVVGVDVVVIERTTDAWLQPFPGLVPFILETVAFTLLYHDPQLSRAAARRRHPRLPRRLCSKA
jgi:hypothetical protein